MYFVLIYRFSYVILKFKFFKNRLLNWPTRYVLRYYNPPKRSSEYEPIKQIQYVLVS